jgi:protoheme IX farnesyltransferase
VTTDALAAATDRSKPSRLADILTLTKVRVNTLVVATTAGGYWLAADGGLSALPMVNACLATALVAGGAAAVNQIYERDVDRLMIRTRTRPVADARMPMAEAVALSIGMTVVGLVMLWVGATPASAFVALATFVAYAFVYTPLKRVTSLSTIVGAVPGALPPIIGWAAARGTLLDPSPWALFLIGFFWQLPHILAIGWMYREDYARASLPVLAVVDTTGAISGRQAMLWAAALIPVSLLPSTPAIHLTGIAYIVGALVLGVAQFALAARFARERSRANARGLFYATLLYLPALWLLMGVTRR